MQQAPGAAEAPETVIAVPGPLSDREGRRLLEETVRAAGAGASRIALDLSGLERLDSRGCAWLIRAVRAARRRGAQVELRGEHGETAEVIELLSRSFAEGRPRPPASAGLLESLGNKAFSAREELRDAWRLVVDAVYWSFIAPFEGRGLRWKGLDRKSVV